MGTVINENGFKLLIIKDLAERVGFEPLGFAKSLAINKIAATIEYNRLADFATKSINSIVPNAQENYAVVGTPWTSEYGGEMDTIANPAPNCSLTYPSSLILRNFG